MPGTVPPLIPLEGEYNEYHTPKFLGLGLIHSPSTHLDPSSTRPRPTAGQQRSLHATGSGGFSLSHPVHHHGVQDGRPFSEHVTTTASTSLDKTSSLRRPPTSLPPLDPIKGKAGDSTKGDRRRDGQAKISHHPTVEDQHLKQSPLYFLSL
jgi:hypothetical protein